MWIRRDRAFEAIVDPALYEQAQSVAVSRFKNYTDEQLLQLLKDFSNRHRMTAKAIKAAVDMPSTEIYRDRFGNLTEAYRRIGYKPVRNLDHVVRDRPLMSLRRRFAALVADGLKNLGLSVIHRHPKTPLTLNGKISLRLVVTRCRPHQASHRWLLRLYSPTNAEITVIARLTPGNDAFLDYFLLWRKVMPRLTQLTLRPGEDSILEAYRTLDLKFLKKIARRVAVLTTPQRL